jgi:hypothetical protein
MGRTGEHHDKWTKPDLERQISYVLSHMWNPDLKKLHRCKRKTAEGGREKEEGDREVNVIEVHYTHV